MATHFGKYRGKVTENEDPLALGRVKVKVPAVIGEDLQGWAMPCVPYAGNGVGFFMLPPVGANIWVEFEGGDIDYPIWSGCFWGDDEVPASPAEPKMKVLKTDSINLQVDDGSGGGVTLQVEPPAVSISLKVTLNSDGITLDAGSLGVIELTSTSVKINDGALEVT